MMCICNAYAEPGDVERAPNCPVHGIKANESVTVRILPESDDSRSDRFKATAYRWRVLAHSCGIKFHYGRAGTPAKLLAAYNCGADSCDSAFPLWTSERMKLFVWRWQGLGMQSVMEYV